MQDCKQISFMIQINLRLLSQVFLLPIRRKDNNMKKEQMNVALDPALKAKIRGMYKSDNCSTMTEFVQKAVEFYIGYLESQNSINFIAPIILIRLNRLFTQQNSVLHAYYSKKQLKRQSSQILQRHFTI